MKQKNKHRSGKKKFLKPVTISLVVCIAAAVAYIMFSDTTAVVVMDNNYFVIEKTDLYTGVNITGEVVSDEINYVFSESEMPVEEVKLNVGDFVKAGDVICTLNTAQLEKSLTNYEKLLSEYDEYNKLVMNNYDNNIAYTSNYSNMEAAKLQLKIDGAQNKYDSAKNSENEYKELYDNAAEESEQYKQKIQNLENRISELKSEAENAVFSSDTDAAEMNENTAEYQTQIKEIELEMAKTEGLYSQAEKEKSFYLEKYKSSQSSSKQYEEAVAEYQKQLEQTKIEGEKSVDLAKDSKKYEELDQTIRQDYLEQIKILKDKIEKSTVRATADGIVTEVYVQEDNYIVNGTVCKIENFDNLHFEAYVLPENVSEISVNDMIIIKFAANDYEDLDGYITEIDDYYDKAKGGYKISFTADNINDFEIYPGFSLSARIILEERKDIIAVPYDAIVSVEGSDFVYKTNTETGAPESIPVTKGLVTSYYVEVISDELHEGDVIKTNLLS